MAKVKYFCIKSMGPEPVLVFKDWRVFRAWWRIYSDSRNQTALGAYSFPVSSLKELGKCDFVYISASLKDVEEYMIKEDGVLKWRESI